MFLLDRDDAYHPEFPQSRGGGLAIDTEMFWYDGRYWPVRRRRVKGSAKDEASLSQHRTAPGGDVAREKRDHGHLQATGRRPRRVAQAQFGR